MTEMNLLPVGTKVAIKGEAGVLIGTIIGHGIEHVIEKTIPIYIVELYLGEYLESKRAYVSTIVVHPDNVEPLKDETKT